MVGHLGQAAVAPWGVAGQSGLQHAGLAAGPWPGGLSPLPGGEGGQGARPAAPGTQGPPRPPSRSHRRAATKEVARLRAQHDATATRRPATPERAARVPAPRVLTAVGVARQRRLHPAPASPPDGSSRAASSACSPASSSAHPHCRGASHPALGASVHVCWARAHVGEPETALVSPLLMGSNGNVEPRAKSQEHLGRRGSRRSRACGPGTERSQTEPSLMAGERERPPGSHHHPGKSQGPQEHRAELPELRPLTPPRQVFSLYLHKRIYVLMKNMRCLNFKNILQEKAHGHNPLEILTLKTLSPPFLRPCPWALP